MKKIVNFIREYLHLFIVAFVAALCATFLVAGHIDEKGYVSLTGGEVVITEGTKEFIAEAQEAIIEYAKTAVPTIIENADGTLSEIDAPTVDYIDGGPVLEECPKDEECGLGTYIWAPTESYQAFKDYTYGKCWNVDGAYGAQCWDLSSLHSMNYTKDNRVFSTCGTGGAKGMWACKEQNAGTEYDLVYNLADVRTGDILVFGNGIYGHTGIAAGPAQNGYIALLGQNQGGSACPGGGAATNIINMSTATFLGAFHPKTYTEPEPTPSPANVCESWNVQQGDTMSSIMLNCEGYVDWSNIYSYADKWISQNVYPGKSVLWGWQNNTHYGLFAGDTIKFANQLKPCYTKNET